MSSWRAARPICLAGAAFELRKARDRDGNPHAAAAIIWTRVTQAVLLTLFKIV